MQQKILDHISDLLLVLGRINGALSLDYSLCSLLFKCSLSLYYRLMKFSRETESRSPPQGAECGAAPRGGNQRTSPRRGASRSRRRLGRAPTRVCQEFTSVSKSKHSFSRLIVHIGPSKKSTTNCLTGYSSWYKFVVSIKQ